MTVYDALRYHMERYRKMTPQDAVKLLYQSEFGGGHMISDRHGARLYLLRELDGTARDEAVPTVEMLGPDGARLNLASLPSSLTPDTLFSMFCESAALFPGSEENFRQKLAMPLSLIEEGVAPFSKHDYTAYLERYFCEGGGAVHHSPAYSSAYRPAYRVVHATFAAALPVFAAIDARLASGERGFSVVIDGRCGSGKSTLSARLAAVYGCGVVHADDYYLPFSARSGQLGNLDADRMRRELSSPGDTFVSRAYDPHKGAFSGSAEVKRTPFFVIEGSYSSAVTSNIGLRPALTVFLTVAEAEQLRRISRRSPERTEDYKSRFIPAEEKYFAEYGVEQSADIVIET